MPRGARRTPLQQAVGLLQRREHSRRELTQKLRARGAEADEVASALERLAGNGLQDDERFAQSLARQRCTPGYGLHAIEVELKRHHLDDAVIGHAIDLLEADWNQLAEGLLQRRFPHGLLSTADQRRASALLSRRGFPADAVRHALDAMRQS